MVDVGAYAAEISLILSIVSLAHTGAVTWKYCFLYSHPTPMVLFTSILLYFYVSFVRKLPPGFGIGRRSFSFQYWKYCTIAFLAVERDYGDLDGFSHAERVGWVVIWVLLMVLTYERIFPPPRGHGGGDHEPVAEDGVRCFIIRYTFQNGIGILGNYFVPIKTICILMILIVIAIVWQVLVELYIGLEFRLSVLSSVLQLTEIVDLSVSIPVPLDIVSFFLCYYFVGWIGMEESQVRTGKILERVFLGLSVSFINALAFVYLGLFYRTTAAPAASSP